eukprot:GSMAST32.ASY1.ANO1.1462.1 assembled CDS
MARLAEQCDRYEDMISYMNRVAESKGTLDVEERNLFSVAYKNVAGGQRASWRILTSLLDANELDKVCDRVTSLLQSVLIPSARYQSEIVKIKVTTYFPHGLGAGIKYVSCRIARESFDAAVSELDTLEECSYKDATLIMQLLRDNLTLWTEEQQSI